MTVIAGKIEDSGGTGLTGTLRVTLDGPLVDTSDTPDAVQLPQSKDFVIAGGTVNITLTESATKNLTYRFEFFTTQTKNSYYFADGGLYTGPKHFWNNNWYTGPTHTADSKLLYEQVETQTQTLLDFHAIVPNVATCEFASLVPTGITTDILDTSLRRLAELLTDNSDYAEALRGGPRFKGDYAAETYYRYGDCVSYGGSTWIYINPSPAAGQTPSEANPLYWQYGAKKGDPGGTNGQDTAYDPTGWDGAMWAPTANVLRDVIETLAPKASPALSGNPTVPTQPTTDETTKVASTLYVANKISDRLANITFTTQANTDSTTKPATTAFVKSVFHRYSLLVGTFASGTQGGSAVSGIQVRVINTISVNAGDIVNLANNVFTLRPGTYRIRASAPAFTVGTHRVFLWSVTGSSRILNGDCASSSTVYPSMTRSTVTGIFTIAANTDFELRHYCQSAFATSGLGVATGEASVNETYAVVELWRLD